MDDVESVLQAARSVLAGQATRDDIATLAQTHRRYTDQEAPTESDQGDTRNPLVQDIIRMFFKNPVRSRMTSQ